MDYGDFYVIMVIPVNLAPRMATFPWYQVKVLHLDRNSVSM